jgi:hypothetical protein
VEVPIAPLPVPPPPIEAPEAVPFLPPPAPPPASREPQTSGGGPSPPGEVAGSLGRVAGGVSRAPSAAAGALASESGGVGGVASRAEGGSGSLASAPGPSGGSLEPGQSAPPGRRLAYVWPAVAIEFARTVAALLTQLDIDPEDGGIPMVDASTSLPRLLPVAAGSRPRQSGDQTRGGASSPDDDGLGFLTILTIGLLSLLALVVLVRLVVGEELFERRRREQPRYSSQAELSGAGASRWTRSGSRRRRRLRERGLR